MCLFFVVFSGTLMLQLDGFPTGDGVKVKVFILLNQSVLTPTQGSEAFSQGKSQDFILIVQGKMQGNCGRRGGVML